MEELVAAFVIPIILTAILATIFCYCVGLSFPETLRLSYDYDFYRNGTVKITYYTEDDYNATKNKFEESQSETHKYIWLCLASALICLALLFIVHFAHKILFVRRGLLLMLIWQLAIQAGIHNSYNDNERINYATDKWSEINNWRQLAGTKLVLRVFLFFTLVLRLIV